jgi:TATA-box binding protein (TBP) (component of TFIID and TFIIIB)
VHSDSSGKVIFGYKSTEKLCTSIKQLVDLLEKMVDELERVEAKQTLEVEDLR